MLKPFLDSFSSFNSMRVYCSQVNLNPSNPVGDSDQRNARMQYIFRNCESVSINGSSNGQKRL